MEMALSSGEEEDYFESIGGVRMRRGIEKIGIFLHMIILIGATGWA